MTVMTTAKSHYRDTTVPVAKNPNPQVRTGTGLQWQAVWVQNHRVKFVILTKGQVH